MIGRRYADAMAWARFATFDAPFSAAEAEQQVLDRAGEARDRTSGERRSLLWPVLRAFLLDFAPLYGFAAVFGGAYRPGVFDGLDAQQYVPIATVCFALGCVGQIVYVVEWRRRGRRREPVALWLAPATIVAVGFSLLVAVRDAPLVGISPAPLAVAAVACIVAAAVAFVVHLASPRRASEVVHLDDLSTEARTALLDERRRVFETLVERGGLRQEDLDAASTQPLGAFVARAPR